MNHEHSVLQLVACYTRVNIGNFDENESTAANTLLDQGFLCKVADDIGDNWYVLTPEGQRKLFMLNSIMLTSSTSYSIDIN
jgi:hypothetical protein